LPAHLSTLGVCRRYAFLPPFSGRGKVIGLVARQGALPARRFFADSDTTARTRSDALPTEPAAPLPRPVHELDFGALATLVASAFAGAPLVCEPMAGGASTRLFFRVKVPRVGSAVAMFVPDGANPEEVAKHRTERGARWPFLEVRDLLASRGVDVPAVYGEDTSSGWVLLEDLGDRTLANFLLAHPEQREEMYVRAVTDLAHAQAALASLPEGSVVRSRAFDAQLLSWEIHHFREWALEARGTSLSAEDRALFDGIAERLARTIAGWPRAFVHRDYQSRNLMVRADGRLSWIDFQDALLGPRVYDLVALLNDSYQVFERGFVEARIGDYARACSLDGAELRSIGREFDLVTVQRKLKDAGRFVFIDRVKQNAGFLKFVEPTIAKARASLARLRDDEDMRALDDLLARILR
jgi:aminoglycoside/choline kinase family phosphotransferase